MKLFRILLVVIVAALGVAALLVVRQRQKLAAMSDDEIRAMLEGKLGGKVDDEQLVRIQEMVIAKVRGGRWSSSSAAAITGTVSYRESDPMPPSAVVIVTLADTSVTDAASQIGAHVIEQPRSVPVDFSVGFDPADIIDNHSYTVEATISSGDALLWTTDTAYPVITRGNPLTADLLLIAVPSSVEQ
jgi:uncharacterized lipoprotein YbaY